MRVGGITGENMFTAMARSVNTSISHHQGRGGAVKPMRTDTARFGSAPRQKSPLEALMEQKQRLLDKKQTLLEQARGGRDVSEQVKQLTEQIAQLDAQMVQQAVADVGKPDKEDKEKKQDKPMTEEEIKAERTRLVMDFAAGMDAAETISKVKDRVDAKARLLKTELVTDRLVGRGLPSNAKTVANKEMEIAELEAKSGQLAAQFGQRAQDMNERIQEHIEKTQDKKDEDGREQEEE